MTVLGDARHAFDDRVAISGERLTDAVPLRQRTVDTVLHLMGGRPELGDPHPAGEAPLKVETVSPFAETEREMIAEFFDKATAARTIVTPRQDNGWLDVNATTEGIRSTLQAHGHAATRSATAGEDLKGVVVARDIVPDLIDGMAVDLC